MSTSHSPDWRNQLVERYRPWFDDMIVPTISVAQGWRKLVEELAEEISHLLGGPTGAPDFRVLQVKEKFGGLRFYVSGVPPHMAAPVNGAINKAESRSLEICEVCGAPGTLREVDMWLSTRCEAHAE